MSTDPSIQKQSAITFNRVTAIWLGIGLVLALAGWYKTVNLLMLVGYVMIALALVNAIIGWLLLRGISAERTPCGAVYPGETLSTSTTIHNAQRFPATVTILDQSEQQQATWLIVQLHHHETRTCVGRWIFPQRGLYPIGPMVADCSYPFGIVHVNRTIVGTTMARVLPKLGRIHLGLFRQWVSRNRSHNSQQRRSSRRAVPGDGDVRGLRPYRPGDAPRTVHWPSSARRGQLLVREYDSTQPINLVIVLEPYLPANPTDPQSEALEWALSLAMTMGQTWCDDSELTDLTLIVAGESPIIVQGPSFPGMARSRFTCLAAVTGTPHCKLTHDALSAMRGRNNICLVISSRDNSPLTNELVGHGLSAMLVHSGSPLPWYNTPNANERPN